MSSLSVTGGLIIIGMITIILENMGYLEIERSLYHLLVIITTISNFIWGFFYAAEQSMTIKMDDNIDIKKYLSKKRHWMISQHRTTHKDLKKEKKNEKNKKL